MPCPFCAAPPSTHLLADPLAFALADAFPVAPGHTLVLPRRCTPSWFDATPAERAAMLALVDAVKARLDAGTPRPDGYTIGVNVGEAAGQTVMHLHVHVIPRRHGDVDDPRGGVRHVIPGRGNYLRERAAHLATGGDDPFLGHVGPCFARATDVAILAAFVQDGGLEVLERPVWSAVERGARVRLVTGDYLHLTQARALERLLDWSVGSEVRAAEEGAARGAFEARVVHVAADGGGLRSFHPKSWRFEGPGLAVAWVGSSNVSAAALGDGIEWNLRCERARDPETYREVVAAFEAWWARAAPLTAEWVAGYVEAARRAEGGLPAGEAEPEAAPQAPGPHRLQEEALAALATTRAEGRRRALVVMATGLGKTWLAAWDVAAVGEGLGRMPRVLFLAHRAELLAQAAGVFRRRFPDARFGWCAADRAELDGDVVLASVQKLSRAEWLARLDEACGRAAFDYVVMDEVHHATADSYRRVLAQLDPGFLLGLTATPDRADEADVLGLFDDNLAYRADLGVGIVEGLLAPFAYWGLRDVVDYTNIPWRNRRFDSAELAAAVATEARMQRLWEGWEAHPGSRTLVFCCSIAHAEFTRDWLEARGVRAVAVHSEAGSADRDESLERLKDGELDAVCSVDVFNEGIDVPAVDRVVMLRPTESPVLFLQQLGRGLRRAAGKDALTVIDFVGNHRVFLDRVRMLVSLASPGERPLSLREFLEEGCDPELPPGCSVDVELEAIEMLRRLLPAGATEVERAYRELREVRGERPTAGELERLGYRPSTLRAVHGSWFEFVEREGDLDEGQRAVLAAARAWLRELETTAMTKSFKMVVLEVLLEARALTSGMAFAELAARCHAYLLRVPELLRDMEDVRELPDPRAVAPERWQAYWRKNPIAAWTGGRWFRVDGERFVPALPDVGEGADALAEMTRELVDWRLAGYVRRRRGEEQGAAFECVVISSGRDPILKFAVDRDRRPDLPRGGTDVRVPDGSMWRFEFVKIACNVARPVGEARNRLPDLLRRWFGPAAGKPGTGFRVRFSRSPDGWWVEPLGEGVIELPPRGGIVMFPSLRAAAGAALTPVAADAPAETVRLPIRERGPDLFAVRAVGDSMDGGPTPSRVERGHDSICGGGARPLGPILRANSVTGFQACPSVSTFRRHGHRVG